MSRSKGQNLAALLGRLRDAGVAEAAFHPDGKLAGVTFVGVLPTPDAEASSGGKVTTPITMARRALEVIQGRRESLEEESRGVVER